MRENQLEITRQGKELLAKALSGERLEFTVATLSDRRNPRRGLKVPIATVAATNNSIDLSVKVDNSDSFQAIEIESIAVYARIKGWLTSEEKFAEVRFDHPDFLLPKADGYDELEYTFVFAIDTDHRGAGGINVQVKRTYDLSRNEIKQIVHDESLLVEERLEKELEDETKKLKKEDEELDLAAYHIYTNLNALAMLVPPANRRITRQTQKWLNDEKARKRDWERFKRTIGRENLYKITNTLRSVLTIPGRYSSDKTLLNVGRLLTIYPFLLPVIAPALLIFSVILALVLAIPAIIADIIVLILALLIAVFLVVVVIIVLIVSVFLLAIGLVYMFFATLINGLIIFFPIVFIINMALWFAPAVIMMIIALSAVVLIVILSLAAVILAIPSLSIVSVICFLIIFLVAIIADVTCLFISLVAFATSILLLPVTILSMIDHVALFAVVMIVGIPLLIISIVAWLAIYIPLLAIVTEVGAIVMALSVPAMVIFAPVALVLGPIMIMLGKARKGSLITSRTIGRADRRTRRLNRKRR